MFLTSEPLAACAGVGHAFFTRAGGVSRGIYTALNCGLGSGDDAASVRENRSRAMAAMALPADALRTVSQVHGTTVLRAAAREAGRGRAEADGLVASVPGIALGVLTADCAPVLFADPDARVIGAAHAGWRGALAGVLAATVEAMEALGAARARITAAVGPCIGQASYEVGPDFAAPFVADDAGNRQWFSPPNAAGRPRFDLEAYAANRLRALGLAAVSVTGADTCADRARFFSYRRARAEGESDYGRALSCIVLAP